MTNLLDLSDKELDKAIESIAKSNPPKKKFWTEKEIEIVRKLKEKGVPTKAIATQMGCNYNAIIYLINKSPYY